MANSHVVESIAQLRDFRAALDMKGKVALVTGAAGGIGRSTAAAFAQCGANVVLMDLPKQEEKLKENCAEIEKLFGVEAAYVMGDVSDEASVQAFVDQAVERFGKIDILHNNAGFSLGVLGKVQTMTKAQWDLSLSVNFTGIFLVGRTVANWMKEHGVKGVVVNTASMSGHIINTEAAYCATKAAVINLTKSMAIEYAPFGIRVNSVSYGGILSGMHEVIYKDPEMRNARYEILDQNTPIGHLGSLSEAAGPVLFLASDLASYMTGDDLLVDGAYVAEHFTKKFVD